MKRLRHEAVRRLKPYRRSAAVIGAAQYLTAALCLLAGAVTEQAVRELPQAAPFYLPAALLTASAARTPLHIQSGWQLGRLTGTLNENDLCFLSCSSSLWLWGRALLLRLTADILLMLSLIPACLLYAAAKSVWLTALPQQEDLLTVLTVLHLGFLAAAALLLPLRTYAASAALPFCILKMPHLPLQQILRTAFRLSRGQTAVTVFGRICTAPLLPMPFTAVTALPVLLTAEQIRFANAWRHQQSGSRNAFSGLELHAAEPDHAA